ncbi:MAG: hypothetical protein K0S44_2670 [Bacteroidetes bacterium]|jgi:hypothetical protein|nr:hypothetical protein [Bacteroidota bacterium]
MKFASSLLFAIIHLSLFGQAKLAQPSTTIKWGLPIRISMIEGENAKTLYFEGAQFTHSDHFLPRYSERISLNGNENNFTASLINPVYETLSAIETAAIPLKAILPSEITLRTDVLTERKQHYGMVSFIPLRKNNLTGKIEKLISFDLKLNTSFTNKSFLRTHSYAANSVLQSGTWYRVATTTDGIFKLSYSFLNDLGIDMTSVDPNNLRVYGNGGGMLPEDNSLPRLDDLTENAILMQDDGDGIFESNEFALFYGTGADTWKYNNLSCPKYQHTKNLYSDSAFYFITFDLGPGKRIQTQTSTSLSPTHIVNKFDDYAFTENDNVNFIKSGRDWYGEYFDNIATYTFSYNFPNIDNTSSSFVKAKIASRHEDASGFSDALYTVTCQGGNTTISIPEITGSAYDDYANVESDCFSFTPNSPITSVNITKLTDNAVGWVDYVEVNVRRNLTMNGIQMNFRDAQSVGNGNVAQYNLTSNTSVQIWDVTDKTNIFLQQTTVSGNNYQFTLPSDSLRQFIAFSGNSFSSPVFSGTIANQNLHSLAPADLIIISHPDFLSQANQLASFHQNFDSLSSLIVTPQQIYNEYSSGAQDISGIRDFLKMFYDRANTVSEIPKYLLIMGDGSYDNKKRFSNNTNFVPTYQSFNSTVPTSTYVSDDFYGLLDDDEGYWDEIDNDAVDLGIGRFPVKNSQEAQSMVDKIIAYNRTGIAPTTSNTVNCGLTSSSPFGDWRNVICFVADDEDNDLHVYQSNTLATTIDTSFNNYNIDKIYLDAFQQQSIPGGARYPGVSEAFNNRVEKGALIINYTGHGGEVGLSHERFLEVSDINKWKNLNHLPLFFTATCEFSRWDDPERTSAGEYAFLNPQGGAIALLTTVRLVFASPNFVLNQNFYKKAFTPVNGQMPRLGDLYSYMKNQPGGNSVNSRNFTLLGDPALRLSYPKHTVSTDSINSIPVTSSASDTIKALSLVSVSGFVRNKSGAILTNYNGVLYSTVFDKAQNITTLSNDGPTASPPFNFKIQKNILYKGKVSVTNGYFKLSFVVPKDIAYQFGMGRISYYAENGSEDANGFYEKIIIGGSNDSAASDNRGPEVKLYMNDTKFVEGGLTDENPDIYAILSDENGINTVGNGIGHDVTAILDANTENSIVLNDFYQADLNSYKSGSVRYPFNELSEGRHTLDFKVWDVHNNSSKAYTEFVVAKSAELALSHVLNYPNPFSTKTTFYFEQNQCCQSLHLELQIFTVSGKLVKNFSQYIYAEGYRSNPIEWDGRDDYGDKIGKGVYVYRLKVSTNEGQTAEKYEKLVILN